jgi:hypothetical protein
VSLWRPETLALGIDMDTVALASHKAPAIAAVIADKSVGSVAGDTGDSLGVALGEFLAALPEDIAKRRPRRLRVLVGTDLCRHWSIAPPTGVASLRELQTIGSSRCRHLFGGREDDWAVVADWSVARPFVCSAIPTRTVRALSAVAQRARLRLRIESALLVAVTRLEPWLPDEGWVGWKTPSHLVIAQRRRGKLIWLRTHRRLQDGDVTKLIEEAARQIARECLRSGDPTPTELSWLGAIDSARAGGPGPGSVPKIGLEVKAIANLPDWLRHLPDQSEARWAAVLAATT